MSNLKSIVDAYLSTFNLYANHNSNRVYNSNGVEQGIYDIKDRSSGEDDGRIQIAFHAIDNEELEFIPTLILHF